MEDEAAGNYSYPGLKNFWKAGSLKEEEAGMAGDKIPDGLEGGRQLILNSMTGDR